MVQGDEKSLHDGQPVACSHHIYPERKSLNFASFSANVNTESYEKVKSRFEKMVASPGKIDWYNCSLLNCRLRLQSCELNDVFCDGRWLEVHEIRRCHDPKILKMTKIMSV